MSRFIEVKNDDYNAVVDLEKIIGFYIDNDEYFDKSKVYFITFKVSYDLQYRHKCNSELEAQMIYAKLRKKLCTDKELNEIL